MHAQPHKSKGHAQPHKSKGTCTTTQKQGDIIYTHKHTKARGHAQAHKSKETLYARTSTQKQAQAHKSKGRGTKKKNGIRLTAIAVIYFGLGGAGGDRKRVPAQRVVKLSNLCANTQRSIQ